MSETENEQPASFFRRTNYEQFQHRLQQLTPAHTAKWGKMDVAQMLEHLCRAIGCGVGVVQLEDASSVFSRTVLKFATLYVIPRFPKNAQTGRTLQVVTPQSFEENRTRLRAILQRAYRPSRIPTGVHIHILEA